MSCRRTTALLDAVPVPRLTQLYLFAEYTEIGCACLTCTHGGHILCRHIRFGRDIHSKPVGPWCGIFISNVHYYSIVHTGACTFGFRFMPHHDVLGKLRAPDRMRCNVRGVGGMVFTLWSCRIVCANSQTILVCESHSQHRHTFHCTELMSVGLLLLYL